MNAKILVDTNVLVYAYDRGHPHKQQQAITLLVGATIEGIQFLDPFAPHFQLADWIT